jgi:hypothetical protein
MGQYWQLINLDKRQTFGIWGKLGQYLFDSDPDRIVPYLILPSLSEVCLDRSSWERFLQAIKAVSWAGDRIICIGDGIEAPYPLGMLSDIEEETEEKTPYGNQELWGGC